MVQIKQLTKESVIIVHQLARDIWPVVFRDILSKDQIEYMLDWMYEVETLQEQAVTGHLFYLITEDGVPKGFIGMEPNYPEIGSLRIHKLYVQPQDHGKGFGKRLLEKAKEVAYDLDLTSIHLNVNRFNKAVDFYKKFGFNIVKEEDIHIGRGYYMEDFVMVKLLSE